MLRKICLISLIISSSVCLISAFFSFFVCGIFATSLSMVAGLISIVSIVLFLCSKRKDIQMTTTAKKQFITVLLICTLVLTVVLEMVCSFFPFPWMYAERTGADHYTNGTYRQCRYGRLAEKYLPSPTELQGARVVDYHHINGLSIETFIHRTDTFHLLSVQYEQEQYEQEKNRIRAEGTDWGNYDSQEEWLLEHQNLLIHDAYSIAVLFDQTQTVLYMVIVTHNSEKTVDEFLYLNYYDAYAWTDIWNNAKGVQ